MTLQQWPERNRGVNPVTLDVNFERFLKRVDPDFYARRWADLVSFGDYVATTLKDEEDYSDRVHPPVLLKNIVNPTSPGVRRGTVHLNGRYIAALQELYKRDFFADLFDEKKPERHLLLFCVQYIMGSISVGCPPAMAHPVTIAVNKYGTPELKARFMPELLRNDGKAKTAGTWGTEPRSGTNIAQTVTEVVPQADGTLRAYGYKHFTSNAGSGVALATMRLRGAGDGDKGIGLYLVPSHIDEDWLIPNEYEVTHLKEKLGTRPLATGEIHLNGALVYELIPPGQGLRVMMEVLGCSRVHNAAAAAGAMREGFMETMCWTSHRQPFNKKLKDETPTHIAIAEMTTLWMAGSALAFESAQCFDAAEKGTPEDSIWERLVTALAKYRTAEQAEELMAKAKVLHGAAGYVEDYPITRLNRDVQVLTVWEGPEQVQAKEIVRMIAGKYPGDAVFIKRLRQLSDALPDDPMAIDKSNLNTRLRFLEDSFAYLRTQPREAAEQVEGEYLKIMSHVLAYALMLKEAAWEITHEQDIKKHLFARHYFDEVLARVKLAPDFSPSKLQSHISHIYSGTKIPSP
jgi:acyl-CoA dehydrogenase